MSRSIEMAKERRASIEETYRRTGNIDDTAKELTDSFYAQNLDYLVPREIFEAVYRQMVRHIAQALEGGE